MTDETKAAGLAKKVVQLMKIANDACAKKSHNDAQNYDYVAAEQVLERFTPTCVQLGIATITKCTTTTPWDATKPMGSKQWNYAEVKCVLTLVDEDTGETWEYEAVGAGIDGGDKHLAKAQTQAKREAQKAAMQLRTKERNDPEADEETDRAQRRDPPKPRPAPEPDPVASPDFVLWGGDDKGVKVRDLDAKKLAHYRGVSETVLAKKDAPEAKKAQYRALLGSILLVLGHGESKGAAA
jgi:ERF superfamily protein